MAKNDYPLDTSGSSITNKITNEQIDISPSSNRKYNYLVPNYAPFFASSFKLYIKEGASLILQAAGSTWNFAFHYQGASLGTAKPIYGGVLFLDPEFSATVVLEYQTLGGQYTLDDIEVITVDQRVSKDPRAHTWEEVAAVKTLFPPQTFPWQFSDMVSATQVRNSLDSIATAIINKAGASAASHLTDYNNPHLVNKNLVGLDKVENFPPSTILEAIAGLSNDTLITPLALKAVLDDLNLLNLSTLISSFNAHITNRNNPHEDVKQHVELAQVENLPIATPSDIISRRSVRKYVTLDQLIEYLALHNNGPEADSADYPPENALLSAYCNNLNKMGVYADGHGGSYEKIIEIDSRDCGYVIPDTRQYPERGTLMSKYCVKLDQYAVYADGYGGTYQQILKVNSAECGYEEQVDCPVQGTVISTRCSGTSLIKTVADGNCGTTEVVEQDSVECGGGQPIHPPAGLLLDTYCKNFDMMGRYSDGQGGTYSAIILINSPDCGYAPPAPPPPPEPPPPPAASVDVSMAINRSSMTVGQTGTVSVTTSNFEPNTSNRYYHTYYKSDPNTDNYKIGITETVFAPQAASPFTGTFDIANHGHWAPGVHKFKVAVRDNVTTAVKESAPVAVNIIANKRVELKINSSADNRNTPIGESMDVNVKGYDFPINTQIDWYLKIRGAEVRDSGKGTFRTLTDANGYFNASFNSVLTANNSVRGNVSYTIVAEWKEGFGYRQADIAAGQYLVANREQDSNVIVINYTDPPPPPPPAVASEYFLQDVGGPGSWPISVTSVTNVTGGVQVVGKYNTPHAGFPWLKFVSIRYNSNASILIWANGPNGPIASYPGMYFSSYYNTTNGVIAGTDGAWNWNPKFAIGVGQKAGKALNAIRSLTINQDGTFTGVFYYIPPFNPGDGGFA